MAEKTTQVNSTEESKRFLGLFIPIQKKLYAYITYHAPNRNDSDDIFQEVAAALLTKFSEYEEGTNFLGWAISIARFKILSLIRDDTRMRILFDEADMDTFQDEALSTIDHVDEDAVYLKECLKKLPQRQHRLLHYRYNEGMTYRQIAKLLNVTMQAVCKATSRIHNSLLKCIQLHIKSGGVYE